MGVVLGVFASPAPTADDKIDILHEGVDLHTKLGVTP